jgi:hypothetical protein
MSALVRALIEEFGGDDLDALADALAPRIARRLMPAQDRWMTTKEAAAYAGCSVHALQKAMAAREVRFEQNGRGGKGWHRAEWLDAWRTGISEQRGMSTHGRASHRAVANAGTSRRGPGT